MWHKFHPVEYLIFLQMVRGCKLICIVFEFIAFWGHNSSQKGAGNC